MKYETAERKTTKGGEWREEEAPQSVASMLHPCVENAILHAPELG